MSTRWILALLFTTACGGSSPAPSTTPPVEPTPAAETILGPNGKHVATERVYEGECMPAGTRGGCHTVTLRPDGTFRNFLFDAAIEGEYTIENNVVTMKGGPDPDQPIKMTLSEDGAKLDALPLKQ